jgi:hypothetical protein
LLSYFAVPYTPPGHDEPKDVGEQATPKKNKGVLSFFDPLKVFAPRRLDVWEGK